MKKQSNSLFTQISTQQLEHLTTIVKETLVAGFNPSKSKIFTVADLWNIQRQRKSTTQNKFSF